MNSKRLLSTVLPLINPCCCSASNLWMNLRVYFQKDNFLKNLIRDRHIRNWPMVGNIFRVRFFWYGSNGRYCPIIRERWCFYYEVKDVHQGVYEKLTACFIYVLGYASGPIALFGFMCFRAFSTSTAVIPPKEIFWCGMVYNSAFQTFLPVYHFQNKQMLTYPLKKKIELHIFCMKTTRSKKKS